MKRAFDIGQYHSTGQRIGSGAYSTVYKGCNIDTNEIVAIKVVDLFSLTHREPHKKENLKERLKVEIKIAQSSDHPNLVKLLNVFESDDRVYLVFEFCNGGDLGKFLEERGALPEEEVKLYLRQIVCGMTFLNDNNIMHRDLKPQNILLQKEKDTDEYTIKIADFGFAKHTVPDVLSETVCGSPLYMAPEVLKHCPYSSKADLWSLGVILYEMVTGKRPVVARTAVELVQNMRSFKIRIPSYLSRECKSLLMGLLRKKEKGRLSIEEIVSHPFLCDSPSPTGSPSSQPIQIHAPKDHPLQNLSGSTSISFSPSPFSPFSPTTFTHSLVKLKMRTICEIFYGIEELQKVSIEILNPTTLVYLYIQSLKMIRDLVTQLTQKLRDAEFRPSPKLRKMLDRCVYRYEQLKTATSQLKNCVNPEEKAPSLLALISQYVIRSEREADDPRTNSKTAYSRVNSSIILLILLKKQTYFQINEPNIEREITRLTRKKKFIKKKGNFSASSSSSFSF